jgi:CRISPR-associated protein Cmr6
MIAHACRNNLLSVSRNNGSHAGLVLSRFLRVPVKDEEKEHSDDRLDLFLDATNVYRSLEFQNVYTLAYQRRKQLLGDGVGQLFTIQGRLVVGLGEESVLETGITLDHTYGVPIIPATALKGLASHYCDRVWGKTNVEFQREVEDKSQEKECKRSGQYYATLFGTSEDSGHITFHDAWITPESLKPPTQGLVLDVMTPHHTDYYMPEDRAQPKPPSDYDSPTPISFLSVAGSFHIAVSCDVADENGKKWELLAMTMLTQALSSWGVGGKTNAGYGRMIDQTALSSARTPSDDATRILTFIRNLRGIQEVSKFPELVERIGKLSEAGDRRRCAEVLNQWVRNQKGLAKGPHVSAEWKKTLTRLLAE